MQRILSLVRRCVEDYHMIEEGDTVAVGVSGGKDSLLTLAALAKLRDFYPKKFDVAALTIDSGAPGMDFSPIARLCDALDVPYHVIPVPIYEIVFEYRKEKNPCSLCAKLRRGALSTEMNRLAAPLPEYETVMSNCRAQNNVSHLFCRQLSIDL